MKKTLIASLIIALMALAPDTAFAVGSGGFENATFSPKSLAMGNAVVATADEPAAISYNPAGLVDVPGIQIQATTSFLSLLTHGDLDSGSKTRSEGTINTIPTSYISINPGESLNNRLAFGIGSDSPFGFANKYESTQPHVRFAGFRNQLKMATVKPTVAFRVNDWISVGVGAAYYNMFDLQQILGYPNVLAGGTTVGQARVKMSGNKWGWTMGVKMKPSEKHHFGFYFRSPVTIRGKGQLEVEGSDFSGNFTVGAKTKVDLPLNITLAYAHHFNERTMMEVDLGFTRWSAFDRLFIDAASSGNGLDDAIINALGKTSGNSFAADKDYSNAMSLHLGGQHKVNDKLTLRAGSLFYWTPISEGHWTPAVPDSNRLSMMLGIGYKVSENLTFDANYMGMYFLKRNINNDITEALGTSLDGKYFSHIQSLGFSVTYKFDQFKDKEQPVINGYKAMSEK